MDVPSPASGPVLASHPRDLARFALDHYRAGRGAALVFVTAVEGGSVRSPGLRMALSGAGDVVGYVSNGCVESDLVARARTAIATATMTRLAYGRGAGPVDLKLPCGGRVDLLVFPLAACHEAVLSVFIADDRVEGTLSIAGDDLAWVTGPAPATGAEVFTVHPKIRLLLFGTGAEALVLASIAGSSDIGVELITPDEATLHGAHRAGIACHELRGLSEQLDFAADGGTAIALLFHDHEWEQRVLVRALASPAFYIGALGSRRAHAARVARLIESGCDEAAVARIHAPIGLVKQLRDPHLLAVSALAEIASEFQARFGSF